MRQFLIILFTVFASAAVAQTALTGTAIVVDGDTINLGPVAVRLNGIDAPEAGQLCNNPDGSTWACGTAAVDWLADRVDGRELTCHALDRDHYGRVIARCVVDGEDIGRGLVTAGLAWAYREYSTDYIVEEGASQAAKIGIWSAENLPPWEYRSQRWERAAAESPRPQCPIKGNINRQGERIYHTPWSPYYARTIIDEASGERWFCDEAEAVAAGWRAARWH